MNFLHEAKENKFCNNSDSISVCMPVFNCEATIENCIKSILWQSFKNWELIVIDDNSVDLTLEILYHFAELDPRIKVFFDGMNKGLAYRLNQAIEISKGKFFARMDGDDISHPERLKKQAKYLNENPSCRIVGSRVIVIDGRNEILGYYPYRKTHKDLCSKPWLGFYLPHSSWMGNLEWFRENKYNISFTKVQDYEFLLRNYKKNLFFCLEDSLLAYRIHNNILIGKRIKSKYFTIRALIEQGFEQKSLDLLISGLTVQFSLLLILVLTHLIVTIYNVFFKHKDFVNLLKSTQIEEVIDKSYVEWKIILSNLD